MSKLLLLDRAGRRRSPATIPASTPADRRGIEGFRYPADPPMIHIGFSVDSVDEAEAAVAALGLDIILRGRRGEGSGFSYEPVTPEDYEARLLEAGVPAWRAFDLAHIASADSSADRAVTNSLEMILDRPLDRCLSSSPITTVLSTSHGALQRRPSASACARV